MENFADKSNEQLLKEIDILKTENAELKKNKDYFQIIAENAVDNIAITTFDLKSKYLYVSPSVLRTLGYEPDELLGKSFFNFIHPEDKGVLLILMKKYLSQKLKSVLRIGDSKFAETIEYRFKHKAGGWRYLQSSLSFIGKNVLAITRDITEQKQMNLALKKSEQRLDSFMNSATDGFMVWDATLNLKEINNVSLDAFPKGTRKEDIIGKNIIELIPDIKESGRFESYKKVLETGESITQDEVIAHSKFGEIVLAVKLFKVGTGVGVIGSDITEKKLAEKKLSNSHNLMQYIIENSNSAIAVHDKNLNYIYVSQNYLDQYKIKDQNVIGKHHYEVFPDLPQKWRDVHQKALLGEISSANDDPYEREDGTVEWTRWECRPWYEANGSIGGIIVYTEIITERKKVEMTLLESEVRFKCIFSEAPIAIEIYNSEGRLIDANRECLNIFGVDDVEELKGFKLFEDPNLSDESKKQVKEGKPYRYETEFDFELVKKLKLYKTSKSGKCFLNILITPYEITDLNENGYLVHIVDISDRKRAEKKLHDTEENLKNTFDISPGMICVANANTGYFTECNLAVTNILGISVSEFMSKPFMEFIHPDDRQITVEEITKQLNGSPVAMFENRYRTKDGTYKWLAWQATAANKDGKVYAVATDITERKLLEKELQQSEEKYRIFFENNDAIILFINPDNGEIIFSNEAAAKYYGYSKEQLISMNINEINTLPPEEIKAKIADARTRKQNYFLLKHKLANGDIRDVEVYQSKLFLSNQVVFSIIVHDITDRLQIRKALSESENLLNATQKIAKVGGWKWTKKTNNMFWTTETYRIHEMDPSEIESGSTEHINRGLKCYDEKDRQIIHEAFLKCGGEGISYDMEFPFTTEKGNRIWIRTAAQPIKENNKVVSVIGNIMDISDSKLAKERLKESEENFKAFTNQSNEGISVADLDGNYTFVNPSFCKMVGWTAEELLQMTVFDVTADKQDTETFKKTKTVKEGEPVSVKLVRKDGTEFIAEVIGKVFSIRGEKSVLGTIRDITERLNSEKALNSALEKAEESDRLKTTFLANMSHEIRTPMNGILGFADLLKQAELTEDIRQKYISIIEKSGVRMLNIINDLIDISKVEAGQMDIVISESNINEQIEYIYTFFKPEVERKGMKLFFNNSLTAKESVVNTDREKMFAILTNLVKNAIKYSDKGSIELGYEKKDNYLEFYVKDTGIGIPKGRQKAIFNRFIQADITDTRAFYGAGLGLTISKAYVEMLGGRIWVESEPGLGSQFYFTIPYTSGITEMEPVTQDSDDNVIPEIQIKKLKILIAEDEELADLLLSLILEKVGKEILHAKNGIEAVEVCRNNPDIDLVLMDIMMPEMYGYEATRKIREFNKDVVIIAQTAFGLAGDREKAIEAGCDDYVSKPINKKLLFQLIEKHIKI